MSDFFNSDIVREELEVINKLQMEIYGSTMQFPSMSREMKIDHVDKLTKLVEKQRIMWTRLSLSDDPEAERTLEYLKQSISMLGFSPKTDMNSFFESVNKTIQSLRVNID
tara:strand:- start:850 stop:1179 length:330 start_codon:yes stop_codon:yes gene_type:complete